MKYHRMEKNGIVVDGAGYWSFLHTVRPALPSGVQDFLFQDWFHNPKDSRCPHDAWLEALTIRELSTGDRKQKRSVEINSRFFGAYHDGFFEMTYVGVTSYSMNGRFVFDNANPHGHEDWLVNEISLEDGSVVHEILFASSSRWIIHCADINYRWLPK